MEILEKMRELYLKKYSKGKWTTFEGKSIYFEDLEDNHLMNRETFHEDSYE